MGKMSVSKGKRYERDIAKKLSEWSGIELVRTPDGAPEDLYADLWPALTTEHFPLTVECKHQEGWSFDQIVNGVGPFYDWLSQAEEQARSARKWLLQWYDPMLVFTKNRYPDMLVLRYGTMANVLHSAMARSREVDLLSHVAKSAVEQAVPVMLLSVRSRGMIESGVWYDGDQQYVVARLEQFLRAVSYEDVHKYLTSFYWTI